MRPSCSKFLLYCHFYIQTKLSTWPFAVPAQTGLFDVEEGAKKPTQSDFAAFCQQARKPNQKGQSFVCFFPIQTVIFDVMTPRPENRSRRKTWISLRSSILFYIAECNFGRKAKRFLPFGSQKTRLRKVPQNSETKQKRRIPTAKPREM